jgi:hypothetical protein
MSEPRRRLRNRFTTPPPVVASTRRDPAEQLETPHRAAVYSVLYYGQKKGIPINLDDINDVFNISKFTATNILASGYVCCL